MCAYRSGKLLSVLVLMALALILNIGYAHADTSNIQGVKIQSVASLPPAQPTSTNTTIPFHPMNPTAYNTTKSQSTTPQYAQKVVKPALGPEPYIEPNIVSVSPGGFDGLGAGGFTPPDVAMSAGPNHVVEMVNSAGQVYNKDGTPAGAAFSLSSFFGTGADFISDPQILYDSQSGRWFASILDVTGSSVTVAVSSTNDPTGAWTTYDLLFSLGTCADQPKIGVSDDKFVASTNDFSNFCGVPGLAGPGPVSFLGGDLFVLDKSELISGAVSLTKFQRFGPDTTKFSIRPAQSLSSTTTEYMVSGGTGTTINLFKLIGVPTAAHTGVTKTITPFTVRTINLPPNANQPGTVTLIDTGDNRVHDVKWRANKLWLALNDACLPALDTTARSCARLIQINTAGTPAVSQDFDIGFKQKHVYYPAVSIEGSGAMDVIAGISSSTIFPSLFVTGQGSTSPPITYQQPEIIAVGSGFDTDNRYGDYFSASPDILHSTVSWVAGEYIKFSGMTSWSTFIANVTTRSAVISLNPNSGSVGTSVTVKGGFFDDNSLTTIKYNGITRDTQTTDGIGNFTSTFAIPSSAFGPRTITATDSIVNSTSNTVSSTFTVTPSVSLNTNSGPVGTPITVTGQGFAASSSTIIKYNGTTITTVVTNTTGGFTKAFLAPPSTLGAHPIIAMDAALHVAGPVSFTINQSTVSLNTNSGPVGTPITVTGQGFAKSSSTIVKFHGVTRSVVTTNVAGTFTTTFPVLSSSVGSNAVLATDASFNAGFTSFTVQPKIGIVPSSGAAGTLITVTGHGFGVLNFTSIKYNGVTQATVLTNGTGSFKTTFVTPSSATGSNVVSAIDASSHTNFTSFTTGAPTTVSLSDVVLQIWNLLNQVRDSITGISANQMILQTVKLASPITFDTSFASSKTVTLSCDKDFILQSLKLVTAHDNAADDFTIDANSISVRNTINLIHPALDPGANIDISNEIIGLLDGPVGVNATDNFVVTVKQTAGAGSADTINTAEAIVLSSGASCTVS